MTETMSIRPTFIVSIGKIVLQFWLWSTNAVRYFWDRDKDNMVDFETDVSRQRINQRAELILHNHGNSILRIAYSYLHNLGDAEDILQDTLIQLIKTAPTFKNETHEKAWLMRVAINLSKNKIKYLKRRETEEMDDTLIGEENSDLSFVWEAVNALPIKYREVIHLFYHEEYSTAEIAKLLNKNQATIRSLLHRGRRSLKEVLKEMYDFEE